MEDRMPSWLDFAPKPRPLEGDDEWTVFLSYRSVDRQWVVNLYDVLTELGHKVFLDQTALKPGDELRPSIGRALKRSQAGVLVWSGGAGTSDWVRREYDAMLNLRDERDSFCFVPIRISDDPMPDFVDLSIFLDFTHYPDGPNGSELMRLLHAIAGQPLSQDAARFAAESDEAAKEAANEIAAHVRTGKVSAGALRRMAEQGGLHWESSAVLAGLAVEGLVRIDANEDALAVEPPRVSERVKTSKDAPYGIEEAHPEVHGRVPRARRSAVSRTAP
ncbi:toll/interleukin-1 receptor domain-containing protein [Roseovarius tibetensis]|uniref:toll/interleukin-1 receptor domain-containing protein n=1 Tax=Roseovarius tibetensis TaxID=2685897 RepID=UPI003D7FF5B2